MKLVLARITGPSMLSNKRPPITAAATREVIALTSDPGDLNALLTEEPTARVVAI